MLVSSSSAGVSRSELPGGMRGDGSRRQSVFQFAQQLSSCRDCLQLWSCTDCHQLSSCRDFHQLKSLHRLSSTLVLHRSSSTQVFAQIVIKSKYILSPWTSLALNLAGSPLGCDARERLGRGLGNWR
ncbi:hypothetical protein TRIATDRAFT_300960 [Trichoderma atroviride IMI 206040]|uniref:Uncharacterized protein n=1 Tax=Hypocrea atroviridis (strain ATCC 20476 / IMI 206040) TaxID=452589 RepID=G9P3K8_HYPAI|nr:uncharacterized protein TRIATDRAFT_300960 [Trichoderma atroviride IMI 206040]EHK42966.1 hypothetical protein TRIATDRAFT_300960 [Trichoderma atroviride IMI 206040]